jgi:ABC-type phosphate transport system substrate-binding protein
MFRILLFISLLAGSLCAARAQDAAFIVNPQSAEASLSADTLKSVLLGNKIKWDGGGVIKLAVLKAGAVHEKVMQDYVQRNADQFDKYWKKLVFSGKGVMPMQAAEEAEIIEYVAKTPGALGYVSAAAVTDRVKVIPIK